MIGDANNIPYSITIAGQTTTFTSGASDDYTAVLTTMESNINNFNISGLVVTRLSDSLHLSRNAHIYPPGSGGANANKLGVFQDQIATLAELLNESRMVT